MAIRVKMKMIVFWVRSYQIYIWSARKCSWIYLRLCDLRLLDKRQLLAECKQDKSFRRENSLIGSDRMLLLISMLLQPPLRLSSHFPAPLLFPSLAVLFFKPVSWGKVHFFSICRKFFLTHDVFAEEINTNCFWENTDLVHISSQ